MSTNTHKTAPATSVNLNPLTTAQINAIVNPGLGWIRFDSTLDTAVIYTSAGWLPTVLNG